MDATLTAGTPSRDIDPRRVLAGLLQDRPHPGSLVLRLPTDWPCAATLMAALDTICALPEAIT